METRSSLSLALVLLILNSLALFTSSTPFSNDEDALLAFKNGVASDPLSVLSSNWSTNASFCSWTGVSCSLDHHHVTALNLSGLHLKGTIAPHLGNLTFLQSFDISSNYFTGSIPSDLTKLRRLQEINVGYNNLSGEIPSGIFTNMSVLIEIILTSNELSGELPSDICSNTPKLKRIFLSQNQVSGKIPTNIYKCRELKVLSLWSNQFNGKIPSEIGNLTMLTTLDLTLNDFQGNIPSSIFNISVLDYMDLSDNNLCGSIPTFNNMPKLEYLFLDYNKLTGSIPEEIGCLTSLINLFLSNNNLTGGIPEEIGNLSRLDILYMPDAFLTGNIPSSIFNISSLTSLILANNSLSGSIPREIGNLSMLRQLDLGFNDFRGTLPSDLGHSLFNLEWLVLASNRLNGPIPTSIANASKLTIMDMNTNSFGGSIPDFGNLKLLQVLLLWGNNLRSEAESTTQELTILSSLSNCRYLRYLSVEDNLLNGILPASIGNFSSSLEGFWAQNNNIMGVIPSEIGNLSSLLLINLGENQLSGPIPPTIGKLKQLQRLFLYDNQLVGSIPIDLCRMNNLGELWLDRNMLVGPIPECLSDVKSLREIHLSSNQLNSTIPPKFWTLTDLVKLSLSSNYFNGQLSSQLGNFKAIYSLDLSSNNFSGDIPTLIDGCQSLEMLNLSHNQFRGSIPKSLGNVKGLITLDLSYNNLSGSIPMSLEDLPFLQYFNVSNNKLEGNIPNGGGFGNFIAQSFSHNFALCGPIRFQVPPCSQNHGRSRLKTKFIVVPSVILAVIVVIVLLVFIKTRKQKKVALSAESLPMIEWRRISYIELERGTNCFSESNLLGIGSFGSVFGAILYDGVKVAVKVFNLQLQGASRSFDTETQILSSIRHRNLVRVIGCCSNPEFKALILTHMPNGSLDKWLYSSNYFLDLLHRLKIAIDVAAALEYLHHGYTFPVVHCDVKPSNVLLDHDMIAHLADFGIAKLFEGVEAFIQTQTLATIGYAAPELGMEGIVSTNGDVYSFGIMLLEMFTGKKPTDDMFGGETSIKEWVTEALQENSATEIVAPALLSREDQHFSAKEQCVSSIFELAMKCLAVSADERINMIEAAITLQKIKATILAATERHRRPYAFSVSFDTNGF